MAQKIINNGSYEDDGSADSIYSSFNNVNDNFTENYSDISGIKGSVSAYANGEGKTYQLLTEAMAVDPLPENNTPFRIQNSTPTVDDGNYIYLSTELDNYLKVGDILQIESSGIIEGSQNVSKSGDVYSYVNDNTLLDSEIEESESIQLFNAYEASKNEGYIRDDGVFISSSAYRFSNKIYVSEGVTYNGEGTGLGTQNGMRFLAAYDADDNLIEAQGFDGGSDNYPTSYTPTVSSGVAYVIASIRVGILNTFMFEEGASKSELVDFKKIISIRNTFVKDKDSVQKEDVVFDFGKNLKYDSEYILGQYIDGDDGLVFLNSSYLTIKIEGLKSEYLQVLGEIKGSNSDDNSFGARHVAFFDEGDAYVSGVDGWNTTYLIPSDASYAQVSILTRQLRTVKISFQDSLTSVIDKEVDTPVYNFEAYGDSTTYGADLADPEAERWTKLLGDYLGVNIGNNGSSGARAEEICALLGGVPMTVTVNGGIIESDLSRTQLTYLDIDPFRGSNIDEFSASITTADGTVINGSVNESGGFSAYGLVSDVTVSTSKVELFSNSGRYHRNNNIIFIGAGINNENQIVAGDYGAEFVQEYYSKGTDSIKGDFIVWGLLDRGITEIEGTIKGDYILEMEAWLKLKYGSKFANVRGYLSSQKAIEDAQIIDVSYTPTADDNTAISNNVTPPSFRANSSTVHLGVLGHKLQALFLKRHIERFIY